MPDLIIACLSQKGGVGKSTLSRLIARTYAAAGWQVKIADFNTKQLSSHNWGKNRLASELDPYVATEPYTQPSRLKRETVDLVVADGRPDSDQTSLDIARLADLVVIPTALSMDDLEPQLKFAHELVSKGVDAARVLFVLNKTVESKRAVSAARQYLSAYQVAEHDLRQMLSYQEAQNFGHAISEVPAHVGALAEDADILAAEIVDRVTTLQQEHVA
jgi:chromosome partitioning protein